MVGAGGALESWVELVVVDQSEAWAKPSRDRTL
jgi:hypothetical protein